MARADRVDVDFGTRMRQAREMRGVSLRQIAETTKLSVRALEALERNDISLLPGGIFSRAFVRSYALEVGMDPEQSVREFIAQFPHDSVTIGTRYESSGGEPPHGGGRWRIAAAAFVVTVLAALLVYALAFR